MSQIKKRLGPPQRFNQMLTDSAFIIGYANGGKFR